MKSFFSLDQLKTKLNFQFSYDQLGPLSLFFRPLGPLNFLCHWRWLQTILKNRGLVCVTYSVLGYYHQNPPFVKC